MGTAEALGLPPTPRGTRSTVTHRSGCREVPGSPQPLGHWSTWFSASWWPPCRALLPLRLMPALRLLPRLLLPGSCKSSCGFAFHGNQANLAKLSRRQELWLNPLWDMPTATRLALRTTDETRKGSRSDFNLLWPGGRHLRWRVHPERATSLICSRCILYVQQRNGASCCMYSHQEMQLHLLDELCCT
jgi:hypothetical protein